MSLGRLLLKLPVHKCGLYLVHNRHKDVYEDITIAVSEIEDDTWVSLKEKQKALDTGELWTLQWYPDTPVGFCMIAAASLEKLLEQF